MQKYDIIPGTKTIEALLSKSSILFSLLVVYQALFGGIAFSQPPQRLVKFLDNPIAKMITLVAVAFTATMDIESAMLAVFIFIGLIYLLRTPEERKKAKGLI